ncbi:hypothetical protein [Streptomyces sp. SAJ15]|uniref:hypothetical protein n=1 Tax=Streptomyces sp. SAJ15 TaxID=2011095 RepID=UPI0016435BFD|nr:hypothetical protein [Streptomyces sp. SAJ15]
MLGLLDFDPDLVHAIDDAGPAAQRAVALLAARRACEAAGLAQLDWIAAGLTALAEGRPLPPPLDDPDRAWQALESDPGVPDRTIVQATPPKRAPFQPPVHDGPPTPMPPEEMPQFLGVVAAVMMTPDPEASQPEEGYVVMATAGRPAPSLPMSQPHMALPALLDAAETDPLQAALDAVYAAVATYGESYQTLLQEIRSLLGTLRGIPAPRTTVIGTCS